MSETKPETAPADNYRGPWFTIEVYFSQGAEEKRYMRDNVTQKQLKQFRENVFIDGIFIPIDPARWVLVSPWCIKSIEITRQAKFFNHKF